MSINPHSLSLVLYPDSILQQSAEEVDADDPQVHAVATRMIEIMLENSGAGLAAPQVGLPWRLFVTCDPATSEEERICEVWINPVLEFVGNDIDVQEEGCLSLPEIRGGVRRHSCVKISGYDLQGNQIEATSDEFIARVWQHENDHLDGILIIDKMSAMDRLICRRQIRDLERAK